MALDMDLSVIICWLIIAFAQLTFDAQELKVVGKSDKGPNERRR